ncbi:MAG: hypothetical protein DRJ64_01165 [Thermoprotei archaeon]|nr:MAG: hypothetical protein DRJ64_01165 [Thermoprotei archaeon]
MKKDKTNTDIQVDKYYICVISDDTVMHITKQHFDNREAAIEHSAYMKGVVVTLQGSEILLIGRYEQSIDIKSDDLSIKREVENKAKTIDINLNDFHRAQEELPRDEIKIERKRNRKRTFDK